MKKLSLTFFLMALCYIDLIGQQVFLSNPERVPQENHYRSSPEKESDLLHTELDISFNYNNSTAIGKVVLRLKPHFYPTDSVTIDAKGMEIKGVDMLLPNLKRELKYKYDGMALRIGLGKTFTKNETYTLAISYIARPNELKAKGSAAITDAKGLYFINPTGSNPLKATQIWTQGETEATSVWCPTIDRPNQKTTQYFKIRVPEKYVSLSNGLLVKKTKNPDGSRTDEWKMDLPHSPYLFFIGVGDYSIIRDQYKGKEVSYYVEKPYASVARQIFGHTPEMIAYFSKITGVEFPWPKYAQITGQEYVSGAMENTTCTLHSSDAQQEARELKDGNVWESVIAHELFHQWFGDYVTAESWSNLTLNESFANYSEVLWYEYKYGKDLADAQNYSDMTGYISSGSKKKKLLRYYYSDKEDMFDAVSYNKGGRILHMLRNFVGDSAFFQSLHLYLNQHKFKSAEVADLRMAFEEVTGKDLQWFFNQWYGEAGHPKLKIEYSYNEVLKKAKVKVEQTQEGDVIFKLPVSIDLYKGSVRSRNWVWVENKLDSFEFTSALKPDLINFDGEKVLLVEKTENKTLSEMLHQYKYAGKYLDRLEAVNFAAKNQQKPEAIQLMINALQDPFHGIRNLALERTQFRNDVIWNKAEGIVSKIALKDDKRVTRSKALEVIGDRDYEKYQDVIIAAASDSSYTLAGTALEILQQNNPNKALELVRSYGDVSLKGKLLVAKMKVLVGNKDVMAFQEMVNFYSSDASIQTRLDLIETLIDMLAAIENTSKLKTGCQLIAKLRSDIPTTYNFDSYFTDLLNGLIERKKAASDYESNKAKIDEQIRLIESYKKRE